MILKTIFRLILVLLGIDSPSPLMGEGRVGVKSLRDLIILRSIPLTPTLSHEGERGFSVWKCQHESSGKAYSDCEFLLLHAQVGFADMFIPQEVRGSSLQGDSSRLQNVTPVTVAQSQGGVLLDQ